MEITENGKFAREGTKRWIATKPDPRNDMKPKIVGSIGWNSHAYEFYPSGELTLTISDLATLTRHLAQHTEEHLESLRR